MKKELTIFQLKWITIVLMCVGMCVIRVAGVLSNNGAELSVALQVWYFVGYAIYLAAFPLVAFLLVEAAKHTSDQKKLLTRLLLAACVVEIPIDIVTFGFDGLQKWGNSQNYFFTMVIGLGVIMLVESVSKKYPQGEMINSLLTLVIYIAAVMLVVIFKTEQGSIGVLTIVAVYLLYNSRKFCMFAVLALYVVLFPGAGGVAFVPAFSLILTWKYYGQEGKKTKWMRVLCYATYPVAYCLIGMIVKLL